VTPLLPAAQRDAEYGGNLASSMRVRITA